MMNSIRQVAQNWLNDRCQVERPAVSQDDLMTPVENYSAVAVDVPCRMIRASGNIINPMIAQAGGQETMAALSRMAFAKDADIQSNDRVRHGGRVYQVVAIEPSYTDAVFLHAILQARE